ncbi:hypothetical protein [Crenobacter luteus]|uniref:hypothetical protein n=1 Tax=Crenobacter luteus TaxID=1452487 RepID=UPI001A9D4EBA|nr:hypothetical protein [Crenobacter luteus]
MAAMPATAEAPPAAAVTVAAATAVASLAAAVTVATATAVASLAAAVTVAAATAVTSLAAAVTVAAATAVATLAAAVTVAAATTLATAVTVAAATAVTTLAAAVTVAAATAVATLAAAVTVAAATAVATLAFALAFALAMAAFTMPPLTAVVLSSTVTFATAIARTAATARATATARAAATARTAAIARATTIASAARRVAAAGRPPLPPANARQACGAGTELSAAVATIESQGIFARHSATPQANKVQAVVVGRRCRRDRIGRVRESGTAKQQSDHRRQGFDFHLALHLAEQPAQRTPSPSRTPRRERSAAACDPPLPAIERDQRTAPHAKSVPNGLTNAKNTEKSHEIIEYQQYKSAKPLQPTLALTQKSGKTQADQGRPSQS